MLMITNIINPPPQIPRYPTQNVLKKTTLSFLSPFWPHIGMSDLRPSAAHRFIAPDWANDLDYLS